MEDIKFPRPLLEDEDDNEIMATNALDDVASLLQMANDMGDMIEQLIHCPLLSGDSERKLIKLHWALGDFISMDSFVIEDNLTEHIKED